MIARIRLSMWFRYSLGIDFIYSAVYICYQFRSLSIVKRLTKIRHCTATTQCCYIFLPTHFVQKMCLHYHSGILHFCPVFAHGLLAWCYSYCQRCTASLANWRRERTCHCHHWWQQCMLQISPLSWKKKKKNPQLYMLVSKINKTCLTYHFLFFWAFPCIILSFFSNTM